MANGRCRRCIAKIKKILSPHTQIPEVKLQYNEGPRCPECGGLMIPALIVDYFGRITGSALALFRLRAAHDTS
jgi:hypothetical protein